MTDHFSEKSRNKWTSRDLTGCLLEMNGNLRFLRETLIILFSNKLKKQKQNFSFVLNNI